MNKELKELLAKINAKKAEVKSLVDQNKLEEAKKAKKDLKELQDKFDLVSDLDDEEQEHIEDLDAEGRAKAVNTKKYNKKDLIKAFGRVAIAGLQHKAPAENDVEVLNYFAQMNESEVNTDTGESDGGLTVPQDIHTDIIELRRTQDDLEMYVNTEPVATLSGSRPIETEADTTPWDNVEEAAEFPEADTPKFKEIKYKIKKRGGILKVTKELLSDTAYNIVMYLNKWIAKKSRATRNAFILKKLDEITTGNEIPANSIDELKDIFNIELEPAIAASSRVYTNQTGFNWLDKLKDSEGKYIMQPDPTDKTKKLLFGEYEIVKLSNKILKNKEIKNDADKVTGYIAPLYCGDLKEAITLFDREKITIEISDQAGDLWGKDLTGFKVRDRFDVQAVDEEAVKKATVTLPVAG